MVFEELLMVFTYCLFCVEISKESLSRSDVSAVMNVEKLDSSVIRYFVLGAPSFIGENINSTVTGIVNESPGWIHSLSWDSGMEYSLQASLLHLTHTRVLVLIIVWVHIHRYVILVTSMLLHL